MVMLSMYVTKDNAVVSLSIKPYVNEKNDEQNL